MGTLGLAATELTLLPPLYISRMVRAKAKMSYHDNGDENGAGAEGESYQGGDSEEEFSDAPPAKKKKSSAKKKVKKAKKEKKKSKYTDDSDEDDIVAEVSEDETAPATWRPGGPVVGGAKAKIVYKDASDQDFTDDGEIDDAADSDFDAGAKAPPKKRSPKKTPAINIQTYAPRIKKYILKSVENGELLQTKGKGAAGRFTVPGLKARKRKSRPKRLSKKFDEDVVEY